MPVCDVPGIVSPLLNPMYQREDRRPAELFLADAHVPLLRGTLDLPCQPAWALLKPSWIRPGAMIVDMFRQDYGGG